MLDLIRRILGRYSLAPITGHAADRDLHVDHEGWLVGDRVVRVPSVRHSARVNRDHVRAIVWHATAVRPGVPLWDRIASYDPKKDRSNSWHCLIEIDGTIYQSVPFTRAAWHCRTTEHARKRSIASVNGESVGIELAAEHYDAPDYAPPQPQVDSALLLRSVLAEHYSISDERAALTHAELDPARRGDPGPAWARALGGK